MSIHGHHAGGMVGFLNGIRLLNERLRPSQVIVIWEGGGSSRRRAIYSQYKAQRRAQKLNRFYGDEIPDSVQGRNNQISVIVEILKKTPVSQIYVPDCEADDVIGYLARYKLKDNKKVIVSSDRDFYQLLNENVSMFSLSKKRFILPETVLKENGISANNFCLARAICGDTSDNIGGIKGAGIKTVSKRFSGMASSQSMTIDDIINESKKMSMGKRIPKIYKEILSNEDIVKRNWKLMYLDTNNLSAYQIKNIDDTIDTFNPVRDKISVMRTLIREGIQTLDVDRLFLSFSTMDL
jgi:5'-3' exonuclease